MLILSREIDEQITIGDDITITIVGVRNGKVKLGIDAPRSVAVDRLEIRESKDRDGTTQARRDACRCGDEMERLRAEVEALTLLNVSDRFQDGWRVETAITGAEYFPSKTEAAARVRELAGLDREKDGSR